MARIARKHLIFRDKLDFLEILLSSESGISSLDGIDGWLLSDSSHVKLDWKFLESGLSSFDRAPARSSTGVGNFSCAMGLSREVDASGGGNDDVVST